MRLAKKYAKIAKALGPRRALLYLLSVVLKRLGIEIEDWYALEHGAPIYNSSQAGSGVDCRTVRTAEALSAATMEALTRTGFIPDAADVSDLLSRGQLCIVAEAEGKYLGSFWAIPRGPNPSDWFYSRRYFFLDRASVDARYRGKRVLETMFRHFVEDRPGLGPELSEAPLLCTCWKFNYSSKSVIERVGFQRIRTSYRLGPWAWHKDSPRPSGQSRPEA